MKIGAITQFFGMATAMAFFLILIFPVFFQLPTISEATEMTTMMMMMIPQASNASSSSSIGSNLDAAMNNNKKKELLLIDSEVTNQRRFLLQQRITPAALAAYMAVCSTSSVPGEPYLGNCAAKSSNFRNTHLCLKYYRCRNSH